MENIKIELATINDLPKILDVYSIARKYMKENGNETQWGENYPPKEMLINDIKNKILYVIKKDEEVHAVFAFIIGEDPTYLKIYEGNWINEEKYGVIHRIASDMKIKGTLLLTIKFALSKINHLRIDTHKNNKLMNEALIKYGFSFKGIIYIDDGTKRNAYEYLK